jgi:NAD(P)-dependent dehydrogenase (short-subunit alcohol dehydrogenase family)
VPERTALVTGASSGLGRHIARRLLDDGVHVVGSGRSLERLRWLTEAGGTAVEADLAEPDAAQRLVSHAPGLSILVNNAVTHTPDAAVTDLSDETWEQVLLVDLTAAMRLIRTAAPVLPEGASIINISTRAAQRATPGHAAYSAAKGGLESLTRSVAMDLAPRGIRCNAIAPGYILHTERDAAATPERLAALRRQQLLPLLTGADVAAVVSWLASDESRALTGLTIPVDGGGTIARALQVG